MTKIEIEIELPVSHSCNLMRVPPFTSMIRAKKSTPTVGSESYKSRDKKKMKTKVSETQK